MESIEIIPDENESLKDIFLAAERSAVPCGQAYQEGEMEG